MPTARLVNQARVLLATAAIALAGSGQGLFAQWSSSYDVTQQLNSMFGSVQYGEAPSNVLPPATASGPSRGPLARLIQNPDPSSGMPPFALTDQQGAIQRYVEPVPGIDLAAHVGQIVVVRHDTGRTLLASQLDLPSQPLTPLIGEADPLAAAEPPNIVPEAIGNPESNSARQADYVDDDDATVQLLSDEEDQTANPPATATLDEIPEPMMEPDIPFPAYPGEMMGQGMPDACCNETGCECDGMNGYGGGAGCTEPCPQCGRFRGMNGYGPGFPQQPTQGRLYAGVELNFLRTNVRDNLVGSDDYEFSPRFTLGFDGAGELGARARYWHYDRQGDAGNSLRLKLNVLDLEATHEFAGPRSGIVLAAGARLANFEVTNPGAGDADCDLAGLTMAADGGVALCCMQHGQVAWVYGGRLSILTGEWDGDNQFASFQGLDDNMLVDELYVGLQYDSPNPNMNLYARLAYEMQNWRSDVFLPSAGIESITFMGPGLEIGVEF